MFPYPFRRYVYGSLLRGRDPSRIIGCLRQLQLVRSMALDTILDIMTPELQQDMADYSAAQSNEERAAISDKYEASMYLAHQDGSNNQAWVECWDILSVKKYREFVLVLATIPTMTPDKIAESFNSKFCREISVNTFALLINSFWDVRKLTTAQIKRSVDDLPSVQLSVNIKKLLFGNPVAAAKSVGASLKLNYSLILEEMLADIYLKYKEMTERKATVGEVKEVAYAVMKIGDRLDKMNKKGTDNDVLRSLLEELKLETHDTGYTMDDFMNGSREIV